MTGKMNNKSLPPVLTMTMNRLVPRNSDMYLIGLLLAMQAIYQSTAAAMEHQDGDHGEVATDSASDRRQPSDYDDISPTFAILYPSFTQTIAVLMYFVLSRYLPFLPYSAIVYIFGFMLGFFAGGDSLTNLEKSSILWLGINGQVLLLVFLPGLIFLDAFTLNVHLFFKSFWQLVLFAFPMVLGGTALTALFAYYVFPYGWGFNLSMTFGAILSGTDPIAVSGLLSSLGAPPRLQMHISGESLLNDGAAVLFYNIFSRRFMFDEGIVGDGLGQDIGWVEGFVTFFRLSGGGLAIGLAFGLGTVFLLRILNNQLSSEESIIQVVLLFSISYLTYFVTEILCLCSGIIATITLGITVKILAKEMINDMGLALHFFEVVGQLLNTLLFILGGTLWGNIISDDTVGEGKITRTFTRNFGGEDWGYLLALFCYLVAARFVLVFLFFPLTSRIGIGTNVKESIFMAFAGFRGTVGIALALSLYADLRENLKGKDLEACQCAELVYCFSGGIALFTLLLIGIASKPVLEGLGLAAKEKTRHEVVQNYQEHLKKRALRNYIRLLSEPRFKGVDHSAVMGFVPSLRDITLEDLLQAVRWHKSNTASHLYLPPALEHVLPYLVEGSGGGMNDSLLRSIAQRHVRIFREREVEKREWTTRVFGDSLIGSTHAATGEDQEAINEYRLTFIELLREAYHEQITAGELPEHSNIAHSLFESLNLSENLVNKGHELNDWEGVGVASATRIVVINRAFHVILLRLKHIWQGKVKWTRRLRFNFEMFEIWFLVRQALAFVKAHRRAQQEFEENFAATPVTKEQQRILNESAIQIIAVERELNQVDRGDVERIKSHFFCQILLRESKQYVMTLHGQGLIPEKDANGMVQDLDDHLEEVVMWHRMAYVGHLGLDEQAERLRNLPQNLIEELNLEEAIEDMTNVGGQSGIPRTSTMIHIDNEFDGLPLSSTAGDLTEPLLGEAAERNRM